MKIVVERGIPAADREAQKRHREAYQAILDWDGFWNPPVPRVGACPAVRPAFCVGQRGESLSHRPRSGRRPPSSKENVMARNPDPVHQVTEAQERSLPGGGILVVDPGWYFWDEVWAYRHGPFLTQEEAEQQCIQYAERL